MRLFGKKEKKQCGCGQCDCGAVHSDKSNMKAGSALKILGGGCAKCNQLEANLLEAMKQLGMSDVVDHIKDYAEIARYGVMTTPAIVYNGKVISYGKVLRTDEIIVLLKKEGAGT